MVRGAARVARAYGISPLVVGLTIVAFGGSTPELLIGTVASGRAQGDLALGNVIGSNIVNIGLVLGVSALVRGLSVHTRLVQREIPIMIATTTAMVLVALDGQIGRGDGILLLLAFTGFVWASIRQARREPAAVESQYRMLEGAGALERQRGRPVDFVLLGVGLAALLLGAQLVVDAAVAIAASIGISRLVVGLTIVAMGTSLPELATSAVAAYRGEADIAVGNVVGSNIFNAAAIIGAAAAVRPIGVNPHLLRFEIPILIGSSLLLLPLARRRLRFGRREGLLLVLGYAAIIWITLQRALGG